MKDGTLYFAILSLKVILTIGFGILATIAELMAPGSYLPWFFLGGCTLTAALVIAAFVETDSRVRW